MASALDSASQQYSTAPTNGDLPASPPVNGDFPGSRRGAGFDGYLTKPIDPEKFISQIDCFLPADLRSSEPPHRETASQESRQAIRAIPMIGSVLIVDNVGSNIALLSAQLAGRGIRVFDARSVAEALRVARQLRPDLIISDIHMPIQSGYELLRLASEDPLLARIPVILITSSINFELEKQSAARHGAADLIPREASVDAVWARILACLELRPRPDTSGSPGKDHTWPPS